MESLEVSLFICEDALESLELSLESSFASSSALPFFSSLPGFKPSASLSSFSPLTTVVF